VRRIGLLVLVLTLVSLSTAAAASFSVQTDGLTSFEMDVTVSVPTTTDYFYLRGDSNMLPGLLSDTAELKGGAVGSKSITADPTTPIGAQTDPTKYHDWETVSLTQPLTIISPVVRLYLEQTGNVGDITAGLLECTRQVATGVQTCNVFATATSDTTAPGEQTITFGSFTQTIPASTATETKTLKLRVVNQAASGKWNIQWGYKDNRPARLEFSAPA
jgi:hypothetical protein